MKLEKILTKQELLKKGFQVYHEKEGISILRKGKVYYYKFDVNENYTKRRINSQKEVERLLKKYGFSLYTSPPMPME